MTEASSGSPTPEQSQAWNALTELGHPSGMPLLNALRAALHDQQRELPEVGYELAGLKGEVLAEAELAWPEQQLAVILNPDDAEPFEAAGWRCWSIDDPPEALANAIVAAL